MAEIINSIFDQFSFQFCQNRIQSKFYLLINPQLTEQKIQLVAFRSRRQ